MKFKLDVNRPSSNREKQAIKSCPLKKHNTIQQFHTLKKSSEQVAVSTATIVAKINPQITAVTTIQNGAFTQKYSWEQKYNNGDSYKHLCRENWTYYGIIQACQPQLITPLSKVNKYIFIIPPIRVLFPERWVRPHLGISSSKIRHSDFVRRRSYTPYSTFNLTRPSSATSGDISPSHDLNNK